MILHLLIAVAVVITVATVGFVWGRVDRRDAERWLEIHLQEDAEIERALQHLVNLQARAEQELRHIERCIDLANRFMAGGYAMANTKLPRKQQQEFAMEMTDEQLRCMQQAVGYAIMYARTEEETAAYALLKLDLDSESRRRSEIADLVARHEAMGCPFNYCDSNPPCIGTCRYNATTNGE